MTSTGLYQTSRAYPLICSGFSETSGIERAVLRRSRRFYRCSYRLLNVCFWNRTGLEARQTPAQQLDYNWLGPPGTPSWHLPLPPHLLPKIITDNRYYVR